MSKKKIVTTPDGKWGMTERNSKSKRNNEGVLKIEVQIIDKDTYQPVMDIKTHKPMVKYYHATSLYYRATID